MGIIVFRILMIGFLTVAGYFFPPFYLSRELGAGLAAVLGLAIMIFEIRIRRAQFRTIWSASLGSFAGVIVGWGLGSIYQRVTQSPDTAVFIRIFFLIIMPYIGFLIGTQKSEWLDPVHFFRFVHEKSSGRAYKILDTSVIIDGRITDICDTAFVEGTLVVPQFVLKELQLVADSADGLKRQRGRRGLDVLDRLQKSAQVQVQIVDLDFPEVRDVDSKLIELANALKPVVLPGETMKVFILKEGKEKDQGVAYLDDGTMVVVDNSRRLIGQTITIAVTSVLQTTVGKMIFGRYNEDAR